MANENTHTKERIRVRYEVAAIQGLTSNNRLFVTVDDTLYPEYIAKLAKDIADEMIKLNNKE